MLTKTALWVLMLILIEFHDILPSMHSKFHHFEELRPDRIRERVKRETSLGSAHTKTLSFSALGKHFVLSLISGSPVISNAFQGFSVNADGKEIPFAINRNNFYSGYLNGNSDNAVDAVYINGVWMAQINAPDEVYGIEPLKHHDPQGSAASMLVFKNSDIKSDNNTRRRRDSSHPLSYCATVKFSSLKHNLSVNNNTNYREKQKSTVTEDSRPYRPGMDTCDILAIADYSAYKGIGEKSVTNLVAKLIFLYQIVDRTFKNTAFGRFINYGIAIKKFIVYTQYTNEGQFPYFNTKNAPNNALVHLLSMTTNPYYGEFCLAHLNTQKFFNHVLGIASVAENSRYTWNQGICGRDHSQSSTNVAVTTLVQASGDINVMQSYALAVNHEIGHTWGAHHDSADDPRCAPSPEKGGYYIMWTYYIQSRGPNSYKFSPCTRRRIGKVLMNKAHRCFQPRATLTSLCGNRIVDDTEDCEVSSDNDTCCAPNCRFKKNAVCSPYHHICCTKKCLVAPPTQQCSSQENSECKGPSFCSGVDFRTCPPAPPAPDHTSCHNHGVCHRGNCLAICKQQGVYMHVAQPTQLEACTCKQNRSAMCMHCCKDVDGVCKIMGGPLYDGTPCLYGVCSARGCYGKSELLQSSFASDKFEWEWFPEAFLLGMTVLLVLLFFSYLLDLQVVQKYCKCRAKINPLDSN